MMVHTQINFVIFVFNAFLTESNHSELYLSLLDWAGLGQRRTKDRAALLSQISCLLSLNYHQLHPSKKLKCDISFYHYVDFGMVNTYLVQAVPGTVWLQLEIRL